MADIIYGKVPEDCYNEYGKDLDGCSTQENEGCKNCSLFRFGHEVVKIDEGEKEVD